MKYWKAIGKFMETWETPYKMLDYRWENHRLNWIFKPCLILPDFTFVGSFLWWAIPPEFSGIVMTRNRNGTGVCFTAQMEI